MQHLGELPDVRARADVLAAELAVEHRPAGQRRSSAGRTTRRPSAAHGVVLSQPIISTTPSNGLARIDSSTSIAAWLRNSIVVGRISVSPRLITGNSSGKPPASSTPSRTCSASSRKCALQGVASRPGVADADHRPAVELVVRNALVLHPRAVHERVAIVATEPFGGAELVSCLSHVVQRMTSSARRSRSRSNSLPGLLIEQVHRARLHRQPDPVARVDLRPSVRHQYHLRSAPACTRSSVSAPVGSTTMISAGTPSDAGGHAQMLRPDAVRDRLPIAPLRCAAAASAVPPAASTYAGAVRPPQRAVR